MQVIRDRGWELLCVWIGLNHGIGTEFIWVDSCGCLIGKPTHSIWINVEVPHMYSIYMNVFINSENIYRVNTWCQCYRTSIRNLMAHHERCSPWEMLLLFAMGMASANEHQGWWQCLPCFVGRLAPSLIHTGDPCHFVRRCCHWATSLMTLPAFI